MIEYGAVLPESGKEKQWFVGLSSKLKKKLLKSIKELIKINRVE